MHTLVMFAIGFIAGYLTAVGAAWWFIRRKLKSGDIIEVTKGTLTSKG